MKLRIKYTNTQKFAVQIEELTFGNLKTEVLKYILSTYDKNLECINLSFNGRDPICGEDDASLESLGIVNGDLLTVIDFCFDSVGKWEEISPISSLGPSSGVSRKSSEKMEKDNSASDSKMEKDNASGSDSSVYIKVSNLLEAADGTPPDSVIRCFEHYSPSSAGEAINLLIHINMVEAGFTLGESPESSPSLPSSWREMVSTIKYHHSGSSSFVCTIVIVTMGTIKQVLVSFPGQESEISVKLETEEYVPSTRHNSAVNPLQLKKLSTLARTFRNKLLFPLQVAAHNILGLPAPWHLAGLPQELLIKIACQLNLKSVLSLSITSKRLYSSAQDIQLWYNLFKRDFPDQYHPSDKVSGADWKAKYKSAYERKKEREKHEKNSYVILEDPSVNNVPPPYNPNPRVPDPYNPFMPQPRGPDPYPLLPDNPQPNPYWDPDSPYFGGEIPPVGPYPGQPNIFDPFGRRPRRPQNPLQPPFTPPQPGFPRMPRGGGPRFDFF